MSVLEQDRQVLQEMSMVDLFYDLLQEAQEPLSFEELFQEIMKVKEGQTLSTRYQARLFTEINIDGRFMPVGDNTWGLRTWYPVDHAEEPVIAPIKKKTRKKKKEAQEAEDEQPEDVTEEDDFIDRDILAAEDSEEEMEEPEEPEEPEEADEELDAEDAEEAVEEELHIVEDEGDSAEN